MAIKRVIKKLNPLRKLKAKTFKKARRTHDKLFKSFSGDISEPLRRKKKKEYTKRAWKIKKYDLVGYGAGAVGAVGASSYAYKKIKKRRKKK